MYFGMGYVCPEAETFRGPRNRVHSTVVNFDIVYNVLLLSQCQRPGHNAIIKMRIALYKHFIDMLLLVFGAMFAIKPAF